MKNFFKNIYRHRIDILFLFILFSVLATLIITLPTEETKNFVNYLENKTFDIRQKIISNDKKVSDDIIIVTVDDTSYEYLIDTYGDWPIPRHIYANILNYIQSQKPKYVAFDFLFINALKRIEGSDKQLVDGFAKYKNTYTAINFDDYSFLLRKPPELDEKLTTDIEIHAKNIRPYKYPNCRIIMKEIIDATDKIGHINTPKSDDGFIRMIPIFINYPKYDPEKLTEIHDNYYLYMTIKLAVDYLNKYENANIDKIVIDEKNNLVLGKKKIPITDKAETILNWYGESGINTNETFKYVSFWEVLKSIEAKEKGEKEILPPDLFKDKVVFIGTNIFSLSDIKTVPTSKYMPGVELHATLFNNIIDNSLIRKSGILFNVLLCIIVALISTYTVFKIKSVIVSIMFYIGLSFIYTYFTTFIMAKYNIWVWLVVPIFIISLTFLCTFIIKYLIKSRDFEYTYKLATTDGLTELYNHRFFQEKLRFKIKESDKNKSKFSLILIDIDFFKKFNDKYGHQAGDAVLKHVASTLKASVRSEDFVCRYGGEEMTIILNGASRETAVNIAKNICNTIASRQYTLTPDLEVNITISLGVATYPENGNNPTDLIEYADKCLYNAKEKGRNQVGFIE